MQKKRVKMLHHDMFNVTKNLIQHFSLHFIKLNRISFRHMSGMAVISFATSVGIFYAFLLSNQLFLKKSFRNTISVKQIGSRSGPTFCWAWSGSNMFVKALVVFLKEFFRKVDFKRISWWQRLSSDLFHRNKSPKNVFEMCQCDTDSPPPPHSAPNTSSRQHVKCLLASDVFCHQLITFANSLEQDQAWLCLGPDLDSIWVCRGEFFE